MKKIFFALLLILSIGCSNDGEVINYDAQNEAEIAKYISDNDLTVKKTTSGLYYIITSEGSGTEKPKSNSNVKMYYKGYFTNGTIFDESASTGVNYNLNLLIPGFSEGMQLLTEGGKATLIIPSRLGYGNKSIGSIPEGSVLIFDVKLIAIN